MELDNFILEKHASIRDALILIEKNKHRSLIIIDEEKKVVGTLSDGDLRKAYINNILPTTEVSKVMNLDFTYLTPENKKDATNVFREKNIFLIPIVDNNFKLIDILKDR